jgi:hypothetical protein
MSRLVLIPFHTTPLELQLDGPARDNADDQLEITMKEACGSIVSILSMGESLKVAYEEKFPEVIAKVRGIIPEANTRLHRSYAWLILATLEVSGMLTVEPISNAACMYCCMRSPH